MWLVVPKLFYGPPHLWFHKLILSAPLAYRLKTLFIRAVCTTHQAEVVDDEDEVGGDDFDEDDYDSIIIPDFVITSFIGSKFLMQRMGIDAAIPIS
jgi:hypothetical protein